MSSMQADARAKDAARRRRREFAALPLPCPPHKGEGVVRRIWLDRATSTERHLPLHGGGWAGAAPQPRARVMSIASQNERGGAIAGLFVRRPVRSEERRVGKEWSSRRLSYH